MARHHGPLYRPDNSFFKKPTINLASSFVTTISQLLDIAMQWRCRAHQRRRLLMMDDVMLRDIGLSRIDVEQETQKPFWRP